MFFFKSIVVFFFMLLAGTLGWVPSTQTKRPTATRVLVAKYKQKASNFVTFDISSEHCSDLIVLEKIVEQAEVLVEPYIDENGDAKVRSRKTGKKIKRAFFQVFVNVRREIALTSDDFAVVYVDDSPKPRGSYRIEAKITKKGDWVLCKILMPLADPISARERMDVFVGTTQILFSGKSFRELKTLALATFRKLNPEL